MQSVLFAVLMSAGAAQAESIEAWVPLTGAEIQAALEDRELTYDGGARQTFNVSGRTLYDSGRPTWGSWEVRGDQYCSQWPPADGWACYDVLSENDGDAIAFVGESGSRTIGRYTDTD